MIGHLRRLDEIARANFFGRDFKRARALVDQPLQDVGAFGPPGAAIGVDRHGMRVDAAAARIKRGDVVGAGRHRGAEPGNIRAELREIGAEIAENVDAHGEEPAVRVERHFGRRQIVAPLRVAEEMLGAVRQPANRTPEPLRRFEDERIFAIHDGLGAEAAADVIGDDAQFVRRDLQDLVGQIDRAIHARPGC